MGSEVVFIVVAVVIGVVALVYFLRSKNKAEDKIQQDKKSNRNNNTVPYSINTNFSDNNNNPSSSSSSSFESPSTYLTREPRLTMCDTTSDPSHKIENTILHSLGKEHLRKKLSAELCGELALMKEWTMVFSSSWHGKSFPRFVSSLTYIRGPSLIIVEEDLTADNYHQGSSSATAASEGAPRDSSHRSIFGGVAPSPWLSVKQREMNAKSSAAAKSRRARISSESGGASSSSQDNNNHNNNNNEDNKSNSYRSKVNSWKSVSEKPSDQASAFFGEKEHCFVFTTNTTSAKEVHSNHGVEVFRPRNSGSLKNSNYQYYFDQHPVRDHVGLGFGGNAKPHDHHTSIGAQGGMALWIDRTFSGQSAISFTFDGSEQLSVKSHFKIKSIELWSLDPETHGGTDEFFHTGGEGEDEPKSGLDRKEFAADRVILELHSGRSFYEEVDRECCVGEKDN